MTSGKIPVLASAPTPGREKQKEVRFDWVLKKTSGPGLDAPFCFDILEQLANIPARITIHELLRLAKETREALRDGWLIQNHFWYICRRPLKMTLNPCALNVIMYSWKRLPSSSLLRICSSRTINMIDPCIILDISARRALRGYRLIQGMHSASFPKGSSTSLGYRFTGYPQRLLRYTV